VRARVRACVRAEERTKHACARFLSSSSSGNFPEASGSLEESTPYYTGGRAQSAYAEWDASNHDITMFGMSRCRQVRGSPTVCPIS
jgi:hypothetical protein